MAKLLKNNAESTLASTASAAATTLMVVDGSVFPSPGSDTFLLTLTQGSGPETSWEVVLCTARTGNDLTVIRAQEGTTAVEWIAGSKVSMRLTAGFFGGSDAPLYDSREWTAATVEQAEAEAGTATTRRAWTAQRVRQAIVAWFVTALAAANEWTGAQTFNGLVSKKSIREIPVTGNAGTAYTINLDNGTLFDLTLDQSNCDFTFPTATAGRQFTLLVTLGAAGRTYTFPSSVRWDADGAPDASTASGLTDRYVFQADGTYWLASVAGIGFDRS